ncbi:MFS transporter [Labilibaculum manganireducens]|uniref:MFS sugar transporter n=1 Tax=Labilibaculum manganireducens TaxID=1940525 RepID=A0A2N3I853_9BACT|nr:MFS transporter [Labilibaculum manganireducens]PKQ66479.1 MFS sugar transporter [Labilibaculum manganireducens]
MKHTLVTKKSRLPIAIWALTVSVFAIGTTEVVMIGLLPTIAKEFLTSISSVGWLVTSYAIGVAIGGPIVTAFTNKVNRKKLLLTIVLFFVLSNGLASISFNFTLLIIARVLSGGAHGVFVGIGANIASSMVSEEKRATAISIMFTGLTVAMVTGVPLGTYIGQQFGWRYTFGGIAVVGFICLLANQLWLPNTIKKGEAIRLKDQFKVLTNKSMLLGFSLTTFSFAALFDTFTYLSPLLEKISGFTENQITLILLLYGIAVAFGNLLGGKFSNKKPAKTLIILFAIMFVTFGLMFALLPYKIPTLILIAIMGFIGFSTVPGMQLYVIQLSEKYLAGTGDVSSVLNISAFNVGIALGSSIGGMLISKSLGLLSITLMSAIFSVLAIIMAINSIKREKLF